MATTTALPADIFDVQVNVPLIHQVVAAQLAAARQGTHSTKTRGLVSGGGKKPYRQKGTGRARQGSTRAPQFAGGGVVHGPQPRDYSQRTPKKMKAAALRGALSDRARNGRIHVIDVLVSGDAPSTSTAAAVLAGLTDRTKFLVVLERGDQVGLKSVRNLDSVHVLAVDQLNTYDVLCADDVVFTAGALATLTASSKAAAAPGGGGGGGGGGKARSRPAGRVVRPGRGGGGGGLVRAGLGLVKCGFWFKSAADAEAAGFKKAGSRAKSTAKDGEDAK
ncbi:MAG: 50S ribosomal protein L4 [Actinomycetales bacterium]|uniref:Large ribosomal subunit protein uL4 n=1 Tax=Candidatus Phosphoribacter hodrii TaxID=2953743 RepID=A0A935IKB8_9MICO|nr:50S ribosomal protein L4 [Candidatus Phosphoribacter hodrii]